MEHPFRNRPIIKNMEKTFKQKISTYTAKQIAEEIGCSMPTAYDWRSGRRSPPIWVQDILLNVMKEATIKSQLKISPAKTSLIKLISNYLKSFIS